MQADDSQSKYENSPKKLKRSNSFVECSPAHGSLVFARTSQLNVVKNGRKLNFDEKDETELKEQPEPSELKATCQQSEGDIIELTQSAKKRR